MLVDLDAEAEVERVLTARATHRCGRARIPGATLLSLGGRHVLPGLLLLLRVRLLLRVLPSELALLNLLVGARVSVASALGETCVLGYDDEVPRRMLA